MTKGLHITPEMMETAYAFLRSTRPFAGWKLPPADEVEFHVVHNRAWGADHQLKDNGVHLIRVSSYSIGRTHMFIEYMAHEMVHLHLDRKGVRAEHGNDFKRCAAQVCRHHGFDPKQF